MTPARMTPARVAVVDRDAVIQGLMGDALTDAGYEVRPFPDVETFLRRLGPTAPDVAILDVRPERWADDWQHVMECRRHPTLAATRFIICSPDTISAGDENAVAPYPLDTAVAILPKPFAIDALLQSVRYALAAYAGDTGTRQGSILAWPRARSSC